MSEHKPIPKIDAVRVTLPATLHLRWRGNAVPVTVNLAGWIEEAGEALAPLRDPSLFGQVKVGEYGSDVFWGADEDTTDLAIDAVHLEMLAEAQRPFSHGEAERWQLVVGLSNQEAADVLGLSLATWKRFKAGGPIPETVVRLCRAAERDPFIVEAYRRPRVSGRPRKQA